MALRRAENEPTFSYPPFPDLGAMKRLEPEAWEQLVQGYSPGLIRRSMRLGLNIDQAEDVIQDTFQRLFENIDAIEPINPTGFLMRIHYNICIDRSRRNKVREAQSLDVELEMHHEPKVSGNGLFDEQIVTNLFSDQVEHEIFPRLRPTYRDAIRLRADGLKGKDAANTLGISGDTYRTHLRRGQSEARTLLRIAERKALKR